MVGGQRLVKVSPLRCNFRPDWVRLAPDGSVNWAPATRLGGNRARK